MTYTILTATSFGTSAKVVEVEAAFTKGLPQFNITGLAHSSILESKQRVLSALANSGITLPPLKVNINLSPSDLPKSGGHLIYPSPLPCRKTHRRVSLILPLESLDLMAVSNILNLSIHFYLILRFCIHKQGFLSPPVREIYLALYPISLCVLSRI